MCKFLLQGGAGAWWDLLDESVIYVVEAYAARWHFLDVFFEHNV